MLVLKALAALLPVVAFLALLRLMDSFKLVRLRTVATAIGAGVVAAVALLELHEWLGTVLPVSATAFSRYVAPVTEETAKAAFVVVLLWRRRIGFLVDAAILGFAVGTGFALFENVDYLRELSGARLVLWLVRGFGTAILHGATTAIFSIVSKSVGDRYPERLLLALVPGWCLAVGIHSLFNHALVSPVLATLVLLVGLPLLVVQVFQRSERVTRAWVGEGLDLDFELLQDITSPRLERTRLGQYLEVLKQRFEGPVLADMLCLVRVELELGIRAKGMLMAREAGLEMPADPALQAGLEEWRFLRESIGTTGLLALKPLQMTSERGEWYHVLLKEAQQTSWLDGFRSQAARVPWRRRT